MQKKLQHHRTSHRLNSNRFESAVIGEVIRTFQERKQLLNLLRLHRPDAFCEELFVSPGDVTEVLPLSILFLAPAPLSLSETEGGSSA